jgi:hypothetical protein
MPSKDKKPTTDDFEIELVMAAPPGWKAPATTTKPATEKK